LTTKIHMLADALGRPLRLIVTAGQVGDITQAPALLDGQSANAVLADKAYDSNALRAIVAGMGAQAVIPSNRTRKIAIPHDHGVYKLRNRIERCFNRLKHFRRFATLDDEAARGLAHEYWKGINEPNLVANIRPTRARASLVLRKEADHRVQKVLLRKI